MFSRLLRQYILVIIVPAVDTVGTYLARKHRNSLSRVDIMDKENVDTF